MVWPDLEDLRTSTIVGLVHVPVVHVAIVVDCISVVEEKFHDCWPCDKAKASLSFGLDMRAIHDESP